MYRQALLCAAVVAASYVCASAQEEEKDRFKLPHITVSGYSHVLVRPDIAILRLGVLSEKPTAEEAASDIAAGATSVIAKLKDLGVDPKDIQTERLGIDPVVIEERDPKTRELLKRTLTGYRAYTSIYVTTHDVDKAGPLATRVVEAGANQFQSLGFLVSNDSELEDQQREKAVEDAVRRAGMFAHGAHMKLGRLLAIEPDPDTTDRGTAADLPTRKGSPQTGPRSIVIPVEPGMETISAHVSATWELIPE